MIISWVFALAELCRTFQSCAEKKTVYYVIALFISKHQAFLALAYTAIPSHSNNQKPSHIFLKYLLMYGTVPIESHCCPVFLRQSSIRRNWNLECRNLKYFSIVAHFILWRPGGSTLFSSLSTPVSDSWSGFLSPSVVLVYGTILEIKEARLIYPWNYGKLDNSVWLWRVPGRQRRIMGLRLEK